MQIMALVGLLGLLSTSPTTTPETVSLPPEMDRVLRDYERAWRAKEPAALAELFTEDGFVLASTKPPVRGRDAIRVAYANAGGPLWLRALSHDSAGRVGYIIGIYGHEEGGAATGKFVLVLHRDKTGRWLIAADMDNSSRKPGE